MTMTYEGTCLCRSVRFELQGEPQAMGFCHCVSCRTWSGDPIHAWTIWSQDSVRILSGAECLMTFHKSADSLSYRRYCGRCGGHLMIHHPALGVFDVFPGVVPTLPFVPAMHINYAAAVLPMNDGLPKYRDFPKEYAQFGGTGELMPE